MQVDLESRTSIKKHVIFDPVALSALFASNGSEAVEQETKSGNAIVHVPLTNGYFKFRLLVDEEPDPNLVRRRQPLI